MSAGTIAKLTFREASRRKVLLAALILGILFLTVYGIGMYFIRDEIYQSMPSSRAMATLRQMGNFLVLAGLYAVNFLTVMMAVLTSADTISGEIASGTIHTLVSKPLRRWEVLIGKWLGYATLVTAYLIMMAGGVLLLNQMINGFMPNAWFRGVALLWLNGLIVLSLTFLGGTHFSTLTNGVMVLGLYGIAFVGGWIEQIGSTLQNQTAVNLGIVSSLILPIEALWRRAAYEMQSTVMGMTFTPFSAYSVPSPSMIIYAILYGSIAVLLAIRQFNRRDL